MLGTDRKVRIRLRQWLVTVAIYAASGGAIGWAVALGWVPLEPWLGWCAFVTGGLAVFYLLLRSGVSQRSSDGALTQWQIAFGVTTVLWGYAMGGPVRSATLFPLMVILTFGAFSLDWRRMALLTVLSIAGLASVVAAVQAAGWGSDPRVDLGNLVAAVIVLPATSGVAILLGRLRMRLRAHRDELAQALAHIERLARHDELTGVLNRRHMQQLLAGTPRLQDPCAVALLDLDEFKQINDRHGHAVGDEALRHVAALCQSALREGDCLARWGGEEFLVLLPGADAERGRQVIERLRERVASQPLPLAGGGTHTVTFSAGVAALGADEAPALAIDRAEPRALRGQAPRPQPRAGGPDEHGRLRAGVTVAWSACHAGCRRRRPASSSAAGIPDARLIRGCDGRR